MYIQKKLAHMAKNNRLKRFATIIKPLCIDLVFFQCKKFSLRLGKLNQLESEEFIASKLKDVNK